MADVTIDVLYAALGLALFMLALRPAIRLGMRLIQWRARRRFLRRRQWMRRARRGDISEALRREIRFYDDEPEPRDLIW